MRGWLIRTGVERSLAEVRHVTPVARGVADGLVADTYRQVEQEFGVLAPPLVLHSPNPAVLAAVWSMLQATLVRPGVVPRADKEAVAAAVSVGNRCPYCVEVHSSVLGGLGGGRAAELIGQGRIDELPPGPLRRVARWARQSSCLDADPAPPPFAAGAAAEHIGVVVTFHLINRMVNIFLQESPMPSGAPPMVRRALRRGLGRVMRLAAARLPDQGRALLPVATHVPDDLAWAQGNAAVATALGRAVAAIEQAGHRTVPDPVRELVVERVVSWAGDPPGLSRDWVRAATDGLSAGDLPLGRLAVLAAFASYQVDDETVAACRRTGADDGTLIGLTAWASLQAARRVGARLGGSPPPTRPLSP
ncbi:carboxymuconolactone decarboxylase family protein [Solwaraspora sp. WMMA2056]|uniref:carboxymuconolactone decarboxylase family protein n=1 Tax=Solwaraspora sp. WMMA2056 TaxID=3015161 RepID=UPI00259B6302|nr:carboxymuconolactone decarboxylase family protein [Solwaraspora sp. WMMA2056]WJK43245.1 carboxymuconolactone decarboxylase family protein [Solwaraspora sp. WMMA2056]